MFCARNVDWSREITNLNVTKNIHTDGRVLESVLLISEQMDTMLCYN